MRANGFSMRCFFHHGVASCSVYTRTIILVFVQGDLASHSRHVQPSIFSRIFYTFSPGCRLRRWWAPWAVSRIVMDDARSAEAVVRWFEP